ncbi:MAG: hypothetical protein U0M12_03165 [Acutalibacteraceae bacterium]|nr:hypothetical protein [Acutalibacteraceae bacterium]
MAFMYNEEAYDISLFETEEISEEERNKKLKINKEIEDEQKAVQRKKRKVQNIVKGVVSASVVVSLLSCIIVGQVQLTELNQQISNADEDLKEQESLYIQAQMKVESKYSSDVVEESAQGTLGMSRADTYQKEYISLAEGDKAEVTETGGTNIFETIANTIAGLWS